MSQRGVSMIEVLVSLAIAAFGLLGAMALQARGLSAQRDAFSRRHAAELVAQFAERMRANHLAVLAGRYEFDFDAAAPTPAGAVTCAGPCTSIEVAARDLDEWRIELRRRLPRSAAYATWNSTAGGGLDVAVAWAEAGTPRSDAVCEGLGAWVTVPPGYRCYRARILP